MSFKQYFYNIINSEGKNQPILSESEVDKKSLLLENKIHEIDQSEDFLFDFSDISGKVKEIKDISTPLRDKFKTLYVLGTGGSTLCPQTLCGIKRNKKHALHNVVFVDNIDPNSFREIEADLKIEETFFLVISKSGRTTETIAQFLIFLDLCEKYYKDKDFSNEEIQEKISNQFLTITSPSARDNLIAKISDRKKIYITEHEKVGGRFSIFSKVGLIPAAFINIDIEKVLEGAKEAISTLVKDNKSSTMARSAIVNYLLTHKGYSSNVIMPYVDGLKDMTSWVAQIWAESLGKNELATTPIRSLGTLDQHSQLQLYLDGRKDKFFNIIAIENAGKGIEINLNEFADIEDLKFLKDKTIGDVIKAATLSTEQTLSKKNLPLRSIVIDSLNGFNVGYLAMHFILETILTAELIDVNPYDQPAVEDGKIIAKEILLNS
jgi:glucose-6-phosphate isomerase